MARPLDPATLVPESLARRLAGRDADAADGGITGAAWLRALPGLVASACERWELRVDGGSWHGRTALVVPVRRADDSAAVLKVAWPHPRTRHEHLALRAWAGRGAVRLLAADPASSTLLLERLDPATDLTGVPTEQACTTIGELLAELDHAPLPQVDGASARLAALVAPPGGPPAPGRGSLPRRFVDQARVLAHDLLADPADARLVHADLHAGNVLRGGAERPVGAWVAVDPQPLVADPAYAVWPALHHRWDEVRDDPRWEIRCRLGWVCDAAGIDEDRARAWALVRTVAATLDSPASGPGSDLTAAVTLLKALQPGA